MLLLIFVGLLASTLAQPPMSTEKPRNFFQQIGDIFKDTFGAFTDTFGNYIKTQGSSLLHNVLPNLAGKLVTEGFWNLIQTATKPDSGTTGKRDVVSALQHLEGRIQNVIQKAEDRAEGLGLAIQGLVNNLLHGRVSPDEYLKILPDLRLNAHDILHQLTGGVLHEVTQLLGEKRGLFDFSNLIDLLHNIEQQGQAVFGQMEQELSALANPANLLGLVGQVAKAVL